MPPSPRAPARDIIQVRMASLLRTSGRDLELLLLYMRLVQGHFLPLPPATCCACALCPVRCLSWQALELGPRGSSWRSARPCSCCAPWGPTSSPQQAGHRGYESQVSRKRHATGCGLVTSHKSQVTRHKSQAGSHLSSGPHVKLTAGAAAGCTEQ